MTAPTRPTNARARGAPLPADAEPPHVPFANAMAWSKWLAKNHASSAGIWMRLGKKGNTAPSVTYADALYVALAWGWIDGQKGKLDAEWWLQRFTPRRAKSLWSKINREKALAHIAAGTIMPAGLAEVERAKSDGRWDAAYDSQSRSIVPEDLAAALAGNPRAARFFETLEAHNRYAILFPIQTARKTEVRAARIEKFVTMLSRHEKVQP